MRILHVFCQNHNIGDYLLAYGVRKLLRTYLDVELIASANLQGQVFDEYYIDEVVNKKYDLLVIGGGGILHGAHWPNGWFWLIEKSLISRIKIPFIIFGVGYNYFPGEDGIPERGIVHLRETFEKALHFTVRNDGSKKCLTRDTGIIAQEIPDPGFFMGSPSESKGYVVIQPAMDKSKMRFSNRPQEDVLCDIRNVAINLSEHRKVILASHVYDDIEACRYIFDESKNMEIVDFGKYAFDKSHEYIDLYKHAEFVLSMRGHGLIVPMGMNVPVISLGTHRKNIDLMHNLELSDFIADVNKTTFSADICSVIQNIETNRTKIKEKYNTFNLGFDESIRKDFDEIKMKLSHM